MFTGQSILVTGGTGSFGRAFIDYVLEHHRPERLIVFSRDELKQFEMRGSLADRDPGCLRYFIGDVRDRDRLITAMEKVDVVVHAAALKQVPVAEYNPFEAIKTNVLGAQNVIDAALSTGVKKVVALSTDKAAAPINLYGATKLCSDKLFVAANNFRGRHDITFSVVRYGNVFGSRGSVIPYFLKQARQGTLDITDERMTRFSIFLVDGVRLVMYALEHMWGGEIFVPRLPSYRISDVATAIGPNCNRRLIGIRPGEKLHEEMITEMDGYTSLQMANHFVLTPSTDLWDREQYKQTFQATPCPEGFSYNSARNDRWLTIPEIREAIVTRIDPAFSPA
ncbi:MAG: UDP-N-acetylglucosamine 4,6-dehydratase (inverting) [Acidobacteria bacterium]|nr:UDP-N-acetylglucosamine 4,6-dehydratase (inverting) [Acidobacteriota bacterium]